MKKNLLFTVIIPVYNMELYLERCLDSIVEQSYPNLQIIIVNDGSSDNSLSIVLEYAEKDKRILVVDKQNEGIGGAYLDAFGLVLGDYVSFVDGDDYIELQMFEILNNYLVTKDVDIIQFGYRTFNSENVGVSTVNFGNDYFSGNVNVVKYRYNNILHPGLSLKVIKSELLSDVQLLRQNIGIDVLLNLQIFSKAQDMKIISNEFYNIQIRDSSVSRSEYNHFTIQMLRNYRNLLFDLAILSKNTLLVIYTLPTFINESIVIANFFFRQDDIESVAITIDDFRLRIRRYFWQLLRCRISVILKVVFFYFAPRLHLRLLGAYIKQ